MSDPNRVTVLDKLVVLADWAKMKKHFTAKEAAIVHGMSMRTVYRYLDALMAIDYRLEGERGVGYLYRHTPRLDRSNLEQPLDLVT
jgi:predicted DNA-binding transcriptional regulator YafY